MNYSYFMQVSNSLYNLLEYLQGLILSQPSSTLNDFVEGTTLIKALGDDVHAIECVDTLIHPQNMFVAAKPGEDLYLSEQVLPHLTIYHLIFLIYLYCDLVSTNNVSGFANLSKPSNP